MIARRVLSACRCRLSGCREAPILIIRYQYPQRRSCNLCVRRAARWRPRAGEPCARADRNLAARGGASSASAQPFSLSLLHTLQELQHTDLEMACSHPHTATEPQLLQAILAELQNLKASQAHLENKVRRFASPLSVYRNRVN